MEKDGVFRWLESKVQSYARSFPGVFNYAQGPNLWDVHGNRYLDFLSGAGSLNYGHNNPVLKQALLDYIQNDSITHSLDLHTAAKKNFLAAFANIILEPRGFDYLMQFTGPTGTNAVEAALKIARKATGRSNIICFTNGFHGVSTGALAATGNKHHRGAAGMPLYGTTVFPYDGYFGDEIDTIMYMDRMLSDPSSGIDYPAAVLVETVQGEGGTKAASFTWLKHLQELCNEREILLIVDDIQAGCGRAGTFFSFEEAGLQPDIVTLSKSLSGYGLPLAIVLFRRALDVWKPGEHNGTFRGNNHAFVTATKTLEYYWQTEDFVKEVKKKSDYLDHRLRELVARFSPHLVEVRGRGMMRGLLCADPERAAAVTAKAFDHGLIIERSGPLDEVIKFLMPLTITYAELDEGLDIIERSLFEEFGENSMVQFKYWLLN